MSLSTTWLCECCWLQTQAECDDQNFEGLAKFNSEGLRTQYVAKTGENDCCFVGLVESEEAIVEGRPQPNGWPISIY